MAPGTFLPLQGAIAQAEAWTQYLHTYQPALASRRPEEIAAAAELAVWFGVKLGEMLPLTWRFAFHHLLRTGEGSWTTTKEFEAIRQEVRRLFFTAREALEMSRQTGEFLQKHTGRRPAGMDRLLEVIEDARQLEEHVFRDWPSFTEPGPAPNFAESLAVDESLAQTLGITIEEARERMETRWRQLNAQREQRGGV